MIETLNKTKDTVNYLGNTTIRIYGNVKEKDYHAHRHIPLEIIMPIDNNYTVYCNNIKYILNEGDILFISSGVLHQLTTPTSGRRHIILADLSPLESMHEFEFLVSILSPVVHITQSNSPRIYERLHRLINNIVTQYESEALFRDSAIYSHLISMFTLIGRNQKTEKLALETTHPKEMDYAGIFLSVCNYINKHFNENITLDQVADLAGFSKYHFSRIFSQYTGISFYQYLNEQRITHAATLLMEPYKAITEVSMECGFVSISAFIRMFKIHKGCTPSEFKGIHSQKKDTR